jgi:lysozyme
MKIYTDIDRGTELYSPLDGKVVKVLDSGDQGFGKHVVIEQKLGEKTFQVCLAHLESTSVLPGQYVIGGQTVVGTLGDTGARGACHLHISAWDVTRSKTSIQHGMVLKPGE